MTGYRDTSFWFDALAESGVDALTPRPGLRAHHAVDVCIVGGGLTGLWTAYYLALADPQLSIAVVEKEIAGFGASGRNGGWCSALFPRETVSLEREHGREAALAMRQAMIDTVAEVGRVVDHERIDCDFVAGGTVVFARSGVQDDAARAAADETARYGVDTAEYWTGSQVERFGVAGSDGGPLHSVLFDPHCARVQPAKLVRGLANTVEAMGVALWERTEVVDFAAHKVTVRATGTSDETWDIRASSIVIATEGYGAALPRVRRRILPLYSLMIATEPLDESVWDEIGLRHGETFSDFRHLLIYGQRTADNRFAFGGRGARYHWGSAIKPEYDRVAGVFDRLRHTLGELFPAVDAARVTHEWGGPLGVARDWHATASFNPKTGVGFAGGYVGDGLSTTNLAGRTMSRLIRGEQDELTQLPWVNHRSPLWEPEPFRFVGANLGLTAMAIADAEESRTARPSRAAKLFAPLTGH